jgi:hypothetical protein
MMTTKKEKNFIVIADDDAIVKLKWRSWNWKLN